MTIIDVLWTCNREIVYSLRCLKLWNDPVHNDCNFHLLKVWNELGLSITVPPNHVKYHYSGVMGIMTNKELKETPSLKQKLKGSITFAILWIVKCNSRILWTIVTSREAILFLFGRLCLNNLKVSVLVCKWEKRAHLTARAICPSH